MSDSNSPIKKIRRVALATNLENQAPTETNNGLMLKTIEELKETTDILQQQLSVMQGQLKIIIESLADNKVVVRKLLRQHYDELPIHKQFTVKTDEKLIQLNQEINEKNRDQYVKAMISTLGTGGVLKNVKYIIDDNVSMEFNVDGVHGKKSLRNIENVFSALLEAISSLKDNQGPPEEQIRKVMQRQKKRQFKNKSAAKSTTLGSV